jgi:hypothetical protein
MPDYGGGSDYKKVSGTSGGSGYTTSSQASSGGSKASQRRKKAAKAAEARAARALADQKKTDAAEAAAARAASQPPPASNTIYQTLANTFTPNDGTSYVDGILTNTGATSFADQVLAADDVTAFMPPSFTPANQSPGYPGPSYQNPGYKADADGDGVNDYQRFQQIYNAQSEAAKNDPYGQSTAQGFISSDGRQSVVMPDGSVKTEFIPTGKTSVSTSTATPVTTTGSSTRLPTTTTTTTPTTTTTTPTTPTVVPPVLPPYVPPQRPTYGGGGLGAFGYSPALMQYESQQGAGQVPYYMAAARNSMNPNMSPAFMHAARNYDILGGMQRIMPRPIEMMSARERAEIMNMGSNFNTPNYNSPYYQPSPQSEFDYFSNMVSGRRRAPLADIFQGKMPGRDFSFGGPGKGAPRPMPQDQRNRAMAGGLAALMNSGMFG